MRLDDAEAQLFVEGLRAQMQQTGAVEAWVAIDGQPEAHLCRHIYSRECSQLTGRPFYDLGDRIRCGLSIPKNPHPADASQPRCAYCENRPGAPRRLEVVDHRSLCMDCDLGVAEIEHGVWAHVCNMQSGAPTPDDHAAYPR